MIIEGNKKEGLYDPGSNASAIPRKTMNIINKDKIFPEKSEYRTMSGTGKVNKAVEMDMKIFDIRDNLKAYVFEEDDHFQNDILLGLDAIRKYRLNCDYNGNITQSPSNNKDNRDSPIINWNENIPISQFEAKTSHLDIDKQNKIKKIIDKYGSIFAKDQYDVGTVSDFEAKILLMENKYIAKKPYRCSYADKKEIESQVAELLRHGMIEQSSSPFASPVTMAYKKTDEDGRREKVRMCIDFRELNKLMVPESQPFPLIDDLICRARKCRWFTALDINSAFWSIPIRKRDRYKTGFITQDGHYQWSNMPFGLKNSPAIFQRIITSIIQKFNLNDFCTVYIDDILIFSKSFEEHLQHIERLLEAIQSVGWKLKFTKCNFATNSVKYLGHIISENEVRPLSDNLISIKKFPVPKSKKNVRQFLGKINFYHKFIQNAARILEPFHRILRKDSPFIWTSECQKTFEAIKEYLTSSPILAIFDRNLPIRIYTDASGVGIGAVLKQIQEDGTEKPVAYFSKKLNESQKKKKAIYIELYAVREAIKFWKYWLLGTSFSVITDHKPLENLNLKARTDEELGDISNELLQYDFKITYQPGSQNSEADCLSRNPVLECSPDDKITNKITFNTISLSEIIDSQKNITLKPQEERDNSIIVRMIKGKKRVVLDKSFGRKLIMRIHERLGHIGKKQMLGILRQHYYFDGMNKMVDEYCASCEICIKNKTRKSRNLGELGHLGPATKPFEIMSLDTVGGFGGRRSTKKYMHILIDHFTRYIYISTSRGQSGTDFFGLIDSVHKNNPIGTLLTDQYGAFGSDDFKKFLDSRKIDHIFTAVDTPSSNGLNERANQTLVNRIRCRINDVNFNKKNRAWTSIAHDCVREYNDTPHSVTSFPPLYLLDGSSSVSFAPESYVPISDLNTDRNTAFRLSLLNHNANKARIDKRLRKCGTLKIGDMVYIENGNKLNRRKLDEIRIGPFPITRALSSSVYEVKTSQGKRKYHVSKMIMSTGTSSDITSGVTDQ